jgi:arylsulfatase A-like enzyme
MNVLLLIVDSMRACSLASCRGSGTRTPFLDRLSGEATFFRRAYATECWTLPTHASMFTGLLPSQHGARFGHMAYAGAAPTVAELLSAAGFETEIVTRNFMFDGSIPGITRGFRRSAQPMSEAGVWNPFALFLAAAKPRFRRHVRSTGFFHPAQQRSRRFLSTFARALMPADRLALDHVFERMRRHRSAGTPYFLFANLYDVHAPYPPAPGSILRPFRTPRGCAENLLFPWAMSRLGSHTYLKPGFRLSDLNRRLLLGRYHRAIELMDDKLRDFYEAARAAGLLDDTVLIVTSDHGEAFGEHDLYLHDASVYDVHLHVPLWVRNPERDARVIDDVVSTRDLFGLIRAVGLGEDLGRTMLDAVWRAEHPIALAEHFHYPHLADMQPRYRQNVTAAIAGNAKLLVRREGTVLYDLERNPAESAPAPSAADDFEAHCRREGLPPSAVAAAARHLRGWSCGPPAS